MGIAVLALRLFHVEIRRLMLIISLVVSFLLVSQCFALPYVKTFYFSPAKKDSTSRVVDNVANSNNLESEKFYVVDGLAFDADASEFAEEAGHENEFKQIDGVYELAPDTDSNSHKELMFDNIISVGSRAQTGPHRSIDNIPTMEKATDSLAKAIKITDRHERDNASKTSLSLISSEARNKADTVSSVSQGVFMKGMRNLNTDSVGNDKKTIERRNKEKETELLQSDLPTLNDNLTAASISVPMRWAKQATTISEMNSLLLQSPLSSYSMRPQVSSVRDRELLSAKVEIENAPVIRNSPGLAASVFQNVSMFKRSYELMERILKVYVYKEGEKPVFHNPRMRGIYASEGWFMKLMEGNKKFVVKDPKKAHLFYLPFSSQMLRITLSGQNYNGMKDLEKYLKRYVELIAGKYRFWNRTGGADHFLVACHDWASQITRQYTRNCIRSLCNANIGKGFKLGKDTTLPVTYIRSMMDPLKDVGGKPASERSILAFFAGGLHGYLRPFLLHYWENKEEDMKIFGPMSRDIEGKRLYREYMKSSKYCICARGYEVHTPRVVESIFYECVPVIISDNYVPPFFEVLNWEAFAVFIQEKDVPNLRNILLSIPQKEYVAMHSRVKMVQQHFFWHRNPVKYDLFHMILHSIWYNRVNQVRTK